MQAQAPACIIGEIATAVVSDGSQAQSLRDAAKVDKHHSERNAHRLFNRYGLALKVPISTLSVPESSGQDEISIPYLKVTDYLQVLLNKYEEVLLGGLKVDQAEGMLSKFWSCFKSYHKDHVAFTSLSDSERRRCIPVLVHGDKGRTLQKSPIFVLTFELPVGLPPAMLKRTRYDQRREHLQNPNSRLRMPCQQRARFFGKRKFEEMSFDGCPLEHGCGDYLRHNSKGHSFLSRFLIAAVPSKVYNRNQEVLPCLLKEVAGQFEQLLHRGLVHAKSGLNFKFAFIGAKGDAEWHWEAAKYNRSYHRTGVVNMTKICPWCDAGAEGASFTDCSDAPEWLPTMAASDPWDTLPPLNHAPFSARFPANMYKFDPFHVLKFGVFRDCVGSCIVRLAAMRYFDFDPGDSKGILQRLQRAYSMYKLWGLAEGKNIYLKGFTKSNFNFEKYSKFPWVNAKGSEVTLLMMWLEFYLQLVLKELKLEEDRLPVSAMLQMMRGGLSYVGVMHSHGLSMPNSCGKLLLEAGFTFLRGYTWMANHCTGIGVSGFRLRPKLHYMHHLLQETKDQVATGAEIISPVMFLCEQNEDCIGRLSRVSRRVSAATASLRTTQRYLVKIRCLLEKLLDRQ
ncbi:unnamed protein product [Symbiodinium natans]|uniref:Uncharacterized protein n=1 Tax=Symbiodinium natans TaxID=878477 RepID=A0A812RP06_9DINO|nr:unnamed protein product [Symbiodinium natans]